jgi:hypothetical protein
MARLALMDGAWRGSAWALLPSGERHRLTQTERVGPFLDGSVKVIEGRGYEADGSVGFNALAIVSYDPDRRAYEMHLYAHGHDGDFALAPADDGFSWEIPAGPATIRYTAVIKDGRWHEVGERIVPGKEPVRVFENDPHAPRRHGLAGRRCREPGSAGERRRTAVSLEITGVSTALLRVPLEQRTITDSQSTVEWVDFLQVRLDTDAGITGLGMNWSHTKPEIRSRRLEPWASHLRALARHPNFACKVAGLVTEADWKRWKPEDLAPYIDVAIEAFGPRRLLVGSDWPVWTLAGDYVTVMSLMARCVAPHADVSANAERVYRLSRPPSAPRAT